MPLLCPAKVHDTVTVFIFASELGTEVGQLSHHAAKEPRRPGSRFTDLALPLGTLSEMVRTDFPAAF